MTRLRPFVLLLPGLVACATPYAKIDGVLANTRPVTAAEAGRVTVVKGGDRQNGELQQSVNKGDSLLTVADGVALLTIRPGYEVIVEPGSVIFFGSNQMHSARNVGKVPCRYYVVELRGDE